MRSFLWTEVLVTPLAIALTPKYAKGLIAQAIRSHGLAVSHTLEILEAGCGRKWNIDLGGVDYRLTGVDLDPDALHHRQEIVGDLHVGLVGDLRTVALARRFYDVTYSAFMLEHVSGAEQVLDRMTEALKAGGLMILRVPDRSSVYAFLARLLPFRLHIWYKRLVDRDKLAGRPGHPPYPVVYDSIVSRDGLARFAESHGLTLVSEVGTNPHLDAMGRLAPLGRWAQHLFAVCSGGRLDGTHSNITLIYRNDIDVSVPERPVGSEAPTTS